MIRFISMCLVTGVVGLGAGLAVSSSAMPVAVLSQDHSAVTPVPREGDWWHKRHQRINDGAKAGNVDLLFIGDSITQGWEGAGLSTWSRFYATRHALNLGISGDRTQHVLWRLENGNIDGISPKVAVIMIGTNNSNGKDNTIPEIADGIRAIVTKLRTQLPEMKIILLDIFPRGEQPNAQRGKVLQVNQIVSRLHDGKHVYYLPIGQNFVEDDGSISNRIMPDFLHLSPDGYTRWAEAIEPLLSKLLGDGK